MCFLFCANIKFEKYIKLNRYVISQFKALKIQKGYHFKYLQYSLFDII